MWFLFVTTKLRHLLPSDSASRQTPLHRLVIPIDRANSGLTPPGCAPCLAHLYICHCQECQKQSASAFGISLEVLRADFRIILGTPKYWSRSTDNGRKLKCAFCPTCGSRLWHESEPASETISIKGGSLDKPLDVSSAIHVWVTRKLPGISIPDNAKQYPKD